MRFPARDKLRHAACPELFGRVLLSVLSAGRAPGGQGCELSQMWAGAAKGSFSASNMRPRKQLDSAFRVSRKTGCIV